MPRKLLSEEEKKKRRSERSKKHYEKNKELIRAQQKEYYAENREEIREDQNSTYWADREPGARKKYYDDLEKRREEKRNKPKFIPLTEEEKKERDAAYRKRYYAENKEEIARKNAIYREEHKDELAEKAKKYNEEHKEELRIRGRKFYQEHKDELSEKNRIWRQSPEGKRKRREEDRVKSARKHGVEVFPMPDNYEEILFNNQNEICYYCNKTLDKDDMHLTHLIPHSMGGPHSFDNVALSCLECRTRKGKRSAEEFLLELEWDNVEGFVFCKKCNRGLPAESFSQSRIGNKGNSQWCKECVSKSAQERKDRLIAEREAGVIQVPETKICTKCNIEKTIGDFNNNSGTRDGKNTHCKECDKKHAKEYKEEHADELRERRKQKYAENRDDEAIYARKHPFGESKEGFKFCSKCGEELPLEEFYKNNVSLDGKASRCKKCCKEYYLANREERLKYSNEYNEEHREELRHKARAAYQENKEEIRAAWKEWYDTPEGKAADKARVDLRRARRKNASIGMLPNNYRKTLFDNQKGLCYYCKRDMNEFGIHLDHKQSLSRGGAHSMENFALACPDCNMRKGAMSEEEFIAYHDEHPELFDYWV